MVAGEHRFSISRSNQVAEIIARMGWVCQRKNGKGVARCPSCSQNAHSQGQPRPLPLGAKWGKMKRIGGWPVALLCSRNAHRGRPIRPPVMAKLGIRKDWAEKGTVDCVIQSIALLHIHTNIRIIQTSGPVRITCAARQKRRRRMQGRKPGKPKDVFAKYGKTGFRPSATQMVADRVRSRTVNVGQAPR